MKEEVLTEENLIRYFVMLITQGLSQQMVEAPGLLRYALRFRNAAAEVTAAPEVTATAEVIVALGAGVAVAVTGEL